MEPESLFSPLRICGLPISRGESNPLFSAVLSDDLEELERLVEAGNSVNIRNNEGNSLLNFVIRLKRVEIFNYLLSLDEIDINLLDRLEGIRFDEYFARRLIEKGVDIHPTDDRGVTVLHWAAKSKRGCALSLGQFLIEIGGNINQQDYNGITPLYAACKSGNFDLVCMLLYYGADVAIATDEGVLPLSIISQQFPEEQQLQLQQILFDYTFDNDKIILRLPTLVAAMTLNSDLFSKILDHVCGIDYDLFDLENMVTSLRHVKSKHLKLFMEKFGYIFTEMIDNFLPLDVLIRDASYLGMQGLKEIIELFLNNDFIADFAQSSLPEIPTISYLLKMFYIYEPIDVETFTKSVCLMLSYGLTVTSTDLDSVFRHFGKCQLFQILLHMDITMRSRFRRRLSMAVLFYDPFSTIYNFFGNASLWSNLLDYYNNCKLKEMVTSNSRDVAILEKVKKLPQVPLLVELSRDAARKFIVKRFHIKNSVQFYTILRWLPIGEMNRNIIALDKKLY